MTATLTVFYLIYLSQIVLISGYFPMLFRNRILYVLKNHPPSEYPKLYPSPFDHYAEEQGRKGLRAYRNINLIIAGLGLGVLGAALWTGYRPNPKGGDEIFVMMYFMLQMSPLFYAEIRGFKQYKRMREIQANGPRKADLNPRRLFDFISPFVVALAVACYGACMMYYLYDHGFSTPWEGEVYGTVFGITAINLGYVGMIWKFMRGKKFDPHQAHKDRLKQIGIVVKTCVISSIGISIFIAMAIIADRHDLELYDPVITSIYMQVLTIFGLGMVFQTKVEAIDYEVYKAETSTKSS